MYAGVPALFDTDANDTSKTKQQEVVDENEDEYMEDEVGEPKPYGFL